MSAGAQGRRPAVWAFSARGPLRDSASLHVTELELWTHFEPCCFKCGWADEGEAGGDLGFEALFPGPLAAARRLVLGHAGGRQLQGGPCGLRDEGTAEAPLVTTPVPPPPRAQLLRKRHIGNDIVTIVFQEPGARPFTPRSIRSHFQHVFVVVRVHGPCTESVCYR